MERLLQIYGAEDQLERILALRKEARQPDRWQPYDLERSYRTYANIESQATSIESYQSQLIPGITQTEAYARAAIEATLHPTSDVNREIEVRLERQRVLSSKSPPEFWLIVTEGALSQQVGGAEVMAEQVEHLIDLSQEPNVTLQVLPFTAGAHVAIRIPAFVIMRIAQHGITTVYTEGQTASMFLTDQEDLDEYGTIFNRLRAASLDEGNPSREALKRIARYHRQRKD
ncbi:hypothetical protein FHS13_001439 [Nocardiopsis algeriensis]|uniref:DUF5753 domain-containing protein n=1 Tax=Nocardiopsis algeriensis TaxID=1478215 RepID=A0A841IMT0_9ACTN|nr:hypothetical protein [Nocardiopsis algeriensis]